MLITDPIYQDADKAREHLEKIRWPDGPECPHCGSTDQSSAIKANPKAKVRKGLYFCNACREQFTVTVGTVYERSKIPLNKWILATHLMAASKTAMSAHQLHRMLGITYKSAWFMCHRIREAMKVLKPEPLGGEGKIVEADETYFGTKDVVKRRTRHGKPTLSGMRAVVALVERDGDARPFHVKQASAPAIHNILARNVRRQSRLHTDESKLYASIGWNFGEHSTVKHSAGEYVRGDVHTNSVEGFFGVFKRGFKTYSHCGEQHLQRYLTEFGFRYNHRKITDTERAEKALEGIVGKLLTYRRPDETEIS